MKRKTAMSAEMVAVLAYQIAVPCILPGRGSPIWSAFRPAIRSATAGFFAASISSICSLFRPLFFLFFITQQISTCTYNICKLYHLILLILFFPSASNQDIKRTSCVEVPLATTAVSITHSPSLIPKILHRDLQSFSERDVEQGLYAYTCTL